VAEVAQARAKAADAAEPTTTMSHLQAELAEARAELAVARVMMAVALAADAIDNEDMGFLPVIHAVVSFETLPEDAVRLLSRSRKLAT
jgi:hypothetical protein